MLLTVNMLHLSMKFQIFNELYAQLIVLIQLNWFIVQNHVNLTSLSHSVIQAAVLIAEHNLTYSASVIDVMMIFCF